MNRRETMLTNSSDLYAFPSEKNLFLSKTLYHDCFCSILRYCLKFISLFSQQSRQSRWITIRQTSSCCGKYVVNSPYYVQHRSNRRYARWEVALSYDDLIASWTSSLTYSSIFYNFQTQQIDRITTEHFETMKDQWEF